MNGKQNKPKHGLRRGGRMLRELNEQMELPGGVLSGGVHIELYSDCEATVDGRCSVLEYTDELILLNTRTGIVKLTGAGLNIPLMEQSCVKICGKIFSVEFTS